MVARRAGGMAQRGSRQDAILGIALIAPLLLWIVATVAYPLFSTIRISLTDLGFLGASAHFVGAANYLALLGSSDFWEALLRTLGWTFGNALLQMIAGFLTALVLNQEFRGQRFSRTWVILPWIVPTVVVAIIWRWMLNGSFGVVNYIIRLFGIVERPLNFLGAADLAMPSLILVNSWRWFPFLAVIILASLQSVPREQYEAAAIDGASGTQRFFRITMPLIRPTLAVLGLVGTLWSVNVFDVVWMLTRGGPVTATTTLPLYIYEKGFQAYRMAEASAASVLLCILLAVFAFVYLKAEPVFREEA